MVEDVSCVACGGPADGFARRGAVAGWDIAAPSLDGLSACGRQPGGRPPGSVVVSLAEHLHLGVGFVDVEGELVELVDELFDVLGLELSQIDRYP